MEWLSPLLGGIIGCAFGLSVGNWWANRNERALNRVYSDLARKKLGDDV